jgi:hypothetical protein
MQPSLITSSSSSSSRANVAYSQSLLLQSINQTAREKARKSIASLFTDPSTLDEIPSLRSRLTKSLSVIDSQLNHSLQAKLDALKRSVEVIQDSSNKAEEVQQIMQRVDERILQTNTSISRYYNLKRVHNARENLSKVISQVEFFARIPDLVNELQEKLNTEPEKLKEVYLESIKLEALREALLKELKLSRARRDSIIAPSSTKSKKQIESAKSLPIDENNDDDDNDDDDDDDFAYRAKRKQSIVAEESKDIVAFANVQIIVDTHLKIVPELSSKIR